MANYPPIYKNATGKLENLLPADGGLSIDVIDCASAASTVSLFDTVDTTGSLSVFAAYDSTCTIGAASSVFTFGGGVTVTENLTVTASSIFSGDVDLGNAAGDTITVTGSVDSDITFENTSARAITIDSQALTLSTTTSGILTIAGATEIQMDTLLLDVNSTGAVTIDAATASNFTVSGATADLTLGARAGTITLNESGETALDANYTATSIVGALNELKTASLGVQTPGFTAGEAITAGDAVYIDYDGASGPELLLADATVTAKSDPCGIALNTDGGGGTVYVAMAGQEAVVNTTVAATNEGNPVYLYGTGCAGGGGTAAAGQLTLVPPAVGVDGWVVGNISQIVGVVSLTGAAGVAKILVQLRESIDL